MGFGVNFNKPAITKTQSTHDGGAGNLGYFEQEEQNRKDKQSQSIFSETGENDSFQKNDDNEGNEFSVSKLIAQVILAIKDWFKKTFG